MLHPIDNILYVPIPGMPEFDIKAIRLQEYLLMNQMFLPARHQVYGSNIARLLQEQHKPEFNLENGV